MKASSPGLPLVPTSFYAKPVSLAQRLLYSAKTSLLSHAWGGERNRIGGVTPSSRDQSLLLYDGHEKACVISKTGFMPLGKHSFILFTLPP